MKENTFTRKHLEIATRLGEVLSSFDVVSTPGVIQDVNSEHAEEIAALEMIANTTKPSAATSIPWSSPATVIYSDEAIRQVSLFS